MDNPLLIASIFLVIAIIIAIPLSKLISRGMLGNWRLLIEQYPGKNIEWNKKRRFTSAMFIGGSSRLRFNNMLQLSSTSDYLGLGTSLSGYPEVVISKSDVKTYSNQTGLIFSKIELKLHKSLVSILFWGRSGRFVRDWWHGTSETAAQQTD